MLFFKCEAASKFKQLQAGVQVCPALSVVQFPDSMCSSRRRWTSVCSTRRCWGAQDAQRQCQDASLLDVMGQQEPGDQVVKLASPPVSPQALLCFCTQVGPGWPGLS